MPLLVVLIRTRDAFSLGAVVNRSYQGDITASFKHGPFKHGLAKTRTHRRIATAKRSRRLDEIDSLEWLD